MTEQITAKTLRALEDIKRLSQFRQHEPESILGGDFNQVVQFPDAVLRVPREAPPADRAMVEYEAEIGFTLAETSTPPPLTVPRQIETWYAEDSKPCYSAISRLPGVVLQQQEVRKLSRAEKAHMGHKIGAFVAWYATTLDIDNCTQLMRRTGAAVSNRYHKISDGVWLALQAYDIDEMLGDVLVKNQQRRQIYASRNLLHPTIVGHDDLRPGNFTFVEKDNQWLLDGVFDFGNTQPSTPERELRHAACLGSDILEPAIESYQESTGDVVSRELIDFWASVQASTVLANCLVANHESGIISGQASMQELYPGYDWSQAFVTLNP